VNRRPPETDPPTYTTGEVTQIFKGKITPVVLERLDKSAVIRPSYYYAKRSLITPEQRDALILSSKVSRGNPERRYTYHDLVWIRLFIYVKDHYQRAGIPNAGGRSGEIIQRIQRVTGRTCPPATRLLFVGDRDTYLLLDDRGVAEHLSADRQLAMRTLLTDTIFAEVGGRIAVLEASDDIRSLRVTANGLT
jgi:hypothetical protein